MNKLSPGLLLLTTLCFTTIAACDTNERCVANCDEGTGSTSEEGSSTDVQESDGLPSGGAELTCEELGAVAKDYIESHRACETLLDCETSRAVCSADPELPYTVVLSLAGISDEWFEIKDALNDVCPCDSEAYSVGVLCDEAGECQGYNAEVDTHEVCPTLPGDIQTFRAANNGCTTNADCVAVESSCYVDACSVVALNVQASKMDWARLDQAGFGCTIGAGPGAGCNFEADCTAQVECSDQGQCITVL